jgi:hypothetical protein
MEKNSESINKIELELTKLYDYFHNDNSKCKAHQSNSIYFCSEVSCNLGYICSECLIENAVHFSQHLHYLVPIDEKRKFFKYLKFPIDNIVKELSTTQKKKVDLNCFYENLKDKIIDLINKHKEQNANEIQEKLNEINNDSGDENPNEIFESQITSFINKNNKHDIQTLIKNLEGEIKKINDRNKQATYEFDSQLDNQINELIDTNILAFYNLDGSTQNDNNNNIPQKKYELKFDFTSIDNGNGQFKKKLPTIEEEESIDENKTSINPNIIKLKEVLETNNKEENKESESKIKSRLEVLKEKINKLSLK